MTRGYSYSLAGPVASEPDRYRLSIPLADLRRVGRVGSELQVALQRGLRVAPLAELLVGEAERAPRRRVARARLHGLAEQRDRGLLVALTYACMPL